MNSESDNNTALSRLKRVLQDDTNTVKLSEEDATLIITALNRHQNEDTKHTQTQVLCYSLYAAALNRFSDKSALKRVATDGILSYFMTVTSAVSVDDGDLNGASSCVYDSNLLMMHCVAIIIDSVIDVGIHPVLDNESSKTLIHESLAYKNDSFEFTWTNLRDVNNIEVFESATTMMELLLPNFLAHLDSISINGIFSMNKYSSKIDSENIVLFVDHVLDVLCGCYKYGKNDLSSTYMKDRPILASTVASVLREFECMFCPGRLSLSGNSRSFVVTRVDALLETCLLPALSSRNLLDADHNNNTIASKQLDSIPPLVYQICLFVTRVEACKDTHRMSCLASIADTFDKLRNELEGQEGNDRTILYTEQILQWTESTVLTHIGNTMRQNQDFGKVLIKLIKTGGNVKEQLKTPLRFQGLSRLRCALLLTVASSLPRLKVEALVLLRDLMIEEKTVYFQSMESLWINSLSSTLTNQNFIENSPNRVYSNLYTLSTEYTSITCSGLETLLASLMQLGFLLIDTVKRDQSQSKKTASSPNSVVHCSVASSGRDLLANLFLHGSDSLRRAILTACSTRVCGHAPNATEHAKLLPKLVADSQTVSFLAEFTGNIVEWLTYLPSGGISFLSVTECIVPCLRVLLSLRKSHIDQTFLLSKKALFCTHENQRKSAAELLIMLLEVVVDDTKRTDHNSTVVDELKGYIRRSFTQQASVRSTLYNAIIAGIERESNSHDVKVFLVQLLQKQLEKYMSINEEKSEMIARQKRGIALGSQLSQPHLNKSDNENDDIPFRLDACTTIASASDIMNRMKGKRKASVSSASMIHDAAEKISEPISFLISSCSRAVELFPNSDLSNCLKTVRFRVSRASKETLIPETGDQLSLLLAAIDLTSSLIGSCGFFNDENNDILVAEELFTLRVSLIEDAALFLESVVPKSKRQKKISDDDKENVNNNSMNLKSVSDKVQEKLESEIQGRDCSISSSFLAKFLDLRNKGSDVDIRETTNINYGLDLQNYLVNKVQHLMSMSSVSFSQFTVAMQLGPSLFYQFCLLCKSKPDESGFICGILRAFTCCITLLTEDFVDHPLSKADRIAGLLRSCFTKCEVLFKKGSYEKLQFRSADVDENLLIQFLNILTSNDGLLMELLCRGMESEAILLCDAIGIAASTICHPNKRASIGLSLICSFDVNATVDEFHGPLSISENSNKFDECSLFLTKAVQLALKLSGDLNSCTQVPINTKALFSFDDIDSSTPEKWRNERGFSLTNWEHWPEQTKHDSKPDSFVSSPPYVLASALLKFVKSESPSQGIEEEEGDKHPILPCFSILSNNEVKKHVESIAISLLHSTESSLADVEFINSKVLHFMNNDTGYLETIQSFEAGRLLAICNIISRLGPCANLVDSTNSFAIALLKASRRFYGCFAKLIETYTDNPCALIEESSMIRSLLQAVSSYLSSEVASLLLQVQEKTDTGKKTLAEAKIESHGKVSVSVVFEREKCDASLLKLCKKLKKQGHDLESTWLERQTCKFNQRDFRIKKSNIDLVREEEMPKKKLNKMTRSTDHSHDSQSSKETVTKHKLKSGEQSETLVKQMVRGSMITVGELNDTESEDDEDENSIDQGFIASENEEDDVDSTLDDASNIIGDVEESDISDDDC